MKTTLPSFPLILVQKKKIYFTFKIAHLTAIKQKLVKHDCGEVYSCTPCHHGRAVVA